MIRPDTISKKDFKHDSLQFEELLRLGIIYAEESSGAIWTDYNEHDPGVTILEYLCYAITDIAYRADFPIKDLLYSKTDNLRKINNAFFPAHKILPTGALTISDYRKLIIDRIDGVQNAWIKPLKSHIHKYHGLYKVYLQIREEEEGYSQQNIVRDTWDLLQANRNLCEDFEEVVILKTDTFNVEATIHLQADAIPEDIYANIVYDLEHFLNPSINFLNPDELKKEGRSNDEIYDGPHMVNGIIKNSDLGSLNQQWYIADFKDIVAAVAGISKIENLTVRHNGLRVHEDLVVLEEDTYPKLDHAIFADAYGNMPIKFKKNGVTIAVNYFQTQQIFHSLSRNEKKGYQLQYTESITPFQDDMRRLENLFDYISIQQFFPHIYGIGNYGLPVGSSIKRKYQAKQLKAYLAFFEIFLKNYLTRLKNVRYLFDIESQDTSISFSEFPFEIPDIISLLKSSSSNPQEDILRKLKNVHQHQSQGNRQSIEFMSHLLARFGVEEQSGFHDASSNNLENTKAADKQILQSKQAILKDFVALSSQRARGINYTKSGWATDNISNLKKRICLETNINKHQNSFLANTTGTNNLLFTKQKKDCASAKQFNLKEMLNYGTDINRYIIKHKEGTYFLVYKSSYNQSTQTILKTDNYLECKQTRSELIRRFNRMNIDSEGFFLIEHLLLRPKQEIKWNLKFGSNSLQPLLESIDQSTDQYLENISNQLLVIAARRTNYSILKGAQRYFILLKNDNYPILVSKEIYSSANAAERVVKKTIDDVQKIKNTNPHQIENWIHLEQERIDNSFTESSFFYAKMSCVIPNWNAKFQNEDFRKHFQHLVGLHTPTHISVDFHWLNFAEMKLFEGLYKRWLNQKQRSHTDFESLDQLSFNLIQFLNGQAVDLKVEDNKISTDGASAEVLKAIYEDVSMAGLYNRNDLLLIEGIDVEIYDLLQQKDIDNWEKLASRDSLSLYIELKNHKSNITLEAIKFWVKQAELGVNNKWQELHQLQNKE